MLGIFLTFCLILYINNFQRFYNYTKLFFRISFNKFLSYTNLNIKIFISKIYWRSPNYRGSNKNYYYFYLKFVNIKIDFLIGSYQKTHPNIKKDELGFQKKALISLTHKETHDSLFPLPLNCLRPNQPLAQPPAVPLAPSARQPSSTHTRRQQPATGAAIFPLNSSCCCVLHPTSSQRLPVPPPRPPPAPCPAFVTTTTLNTYLLTPLLLFPHHKPSSTPLINYVLVLIGIFYVL